MESSPESGLLSHLQNNLSELGWPGLLAILVGSCIVTRILTGIWSNGPKVEEGQPRRVRTTPYWFPWLGHGLSFVWNHVRLLTKARDSMGEPVVGIKLGGTKHSVLVSPSVAKSALSSPNTSSTAVINYALKTVFGDRGPVQKSSASNPHLLQLLHHNIPDLFSREPYVTEISNAVCRLIERETPNLVTFNWSPVDQTPWERTCDVDLLEGTDKPTCETNLFALIRNHLGHITTTTIMGYAVLENFPNLLPDLWKLNDQFVPLSMGLPRWVLPGTSAASVARARLLDTLTVYHQAFVAWDDGADPGVKFRDLDDISEPIKERARALKAAGLSPSASAPAHLSLLWAMNANSPNIVFWLLLHLYTNPTLLADIRAEIAPFAKAHRPTPAETGFPFVEAARIALDTDNLLESCPLLRASVSETLRLDLAALSFRTLTADLTVTESPEDAALAGRAKPLTYLIPEGESILVPHGVLHTDPQHFSNPTQFDPLRFIQTDPDTGKLRAARDPISPFGAGVSACKGRVFAEREILSYTAAIISLWDLQPAGGGGVWKIPGHKQSSAAYLPTRDVRVRLTARV
ncbi:cytochrome P450 [Aspergillus candidus]|uniref:Putative cytochrome P450 n=1 Tax=Aspergillus candidus TaxID=41067 RepID=A0A2I2F9F0_ASPCN|nr:putative cytochrome P450 [Aspergillus candidus]PLB37253.1 putative cytochrome P450 [Aspergillus candidus]